MKGKRGLSEIIIAIIMILLVLIAIGIIWAVVNNLLQRSSSEVSLGKITTSLVIEKQQSMVGLTDLKVIVKRNAGKGDLSGIKFIVSNGSKTMEYTSLQSLTELGSSVFTIPFYPNLTGTIQDVQIAPVIQLDNKKVSIGNIADKQELSDGLTSERSALYASYRFDSISGGKTPDAVGNFDGTVSGFPSIVQDTQRGNVLNLFGTDGGSYALNQYLNLGDLNYITAGSGQYSVSIWVFTTITGRQLIFGDEQNTNDGVLLETDLTNKLESWNGNPSPGPRVFDYTLPLNTWTHLVLVQDTDLKLYVNGQLIPHNTWTTPTTHIDTSISTTVGKWIYDDTTGNHRYFRGKMDNLHVFKRALTAQEITDLYNSQK